MERIKGQYARQVWLLLVQVLDGLPISVRTAQRRGVLRHVVNDDGIFHNRNWRPDVDNETSESHSSALRHSYC
jgi:hypothetical protein